MASLQEIGIIVAPNLLIGSPFTYDRYTDNGQKEGWPSVGWPVALVTVVGWMVVLASLYGARMQMQAEGERQRREHEVERIRRWSEQAGQAVARAEIALEAIMSLRELDVDLADFIANFDLEDMQTRLWNAAGVRVELRTVLALSLDSDVSKLLIEVERRLQDASEVVTALLNEQKLYGGDREQISNTTAAAWSSFITEHDGSYDESLGSLPTPQIFAVLRDQIANISARINSTS